MNFSLNQLRYILRDRNRSEKKKNELRTGLESNIEEITNVLRIRVLRSAQLVEELYIYTRSVCRQM